MSHTPLHTLGENAVLHKLLAKLHSDESLIVGPGDDCAVVARNEEWDALLKTDVVVENIHFTPDTPPQLIGRKALARAVSDIAAMGGIPEHALITLLVHPKRDVEQLEGIYEGISQLAAQFGVSIAGGETSSLPIDGLAINVALTGRVEKGRAILRSGGRPGDIICVSGPLGGSFPTQHHLLFTPRVELARELLHSDCCPTSMMDLSDGIAVDLPRLAAASQCGFILEPEQIPCNPECSISQALKDGEDYELLFTVAEEHLDDIVAKGLFPIGKLCSDLQKNTLSGGWQHFTT